MTAGSDSLPLAEYIELRVVIELAGVSEVRHCRLVAHTRQGEGEAVTVGLKDNPVEREEALQVRLGEQALGFHVFKIIRCGH